MSQHYAYTPAIWPAILTALFLLVLAGYGWRRRHVPGALPFVLSCVFTFLWTAGLAMQAAATDAATQRWWMAVGGAWALPALTAVTGFILEYAWPGRWLTRRNLLLLSIAPLLFVALMLTDPFHHLMIRYPAGGDASARPFGPGGWVALAYSIVLGIVNVAALSWLFVRSPRHRRLVALMIAGQIVTRLLFIQQSLSPDALRLPFNAPVIALPYVVYAVALFSFHIFDPLVMAHRTAIEQLDVGVLALDTGQRVIDLNPAAERILRLPLDRARGRPVGELLPAPVGEYLGGEHATEVGLSLGAPPDARAYTLGVSPLRDWRGLDVGTLLLLHDVTEQQRAQAQIVAQQRALATLQERERLARELHDGAGQMFGYVSLQAQAIHKLVGDGHLTAAAGQLARLVDVASAAHTDLRESILSLKAGAGASPGLLAALQPYLAAYQSNYGIAVALSVADDLSDDDFTPDTTAQLLRVITEALTNARRHGGASRVDITVAGEGDMARVTVTDDGRGFDAGASGDGAGGHFGLAFMRERMAQVGGGIAIDSRPGAGTRVTLDVPRRDAAKVDAQ